MYCFRSPVICQKSISCLLLNGGLFLGLIQFFTHILMPVIAAVSSFLICFIATLVSLFSSDSTATEKHASSAPSLSPAAPAHAGDLPALSPLLSFDVFSPLVLALFPFFPSLGSSPDARVPLAAGGPAPGAASPFGRHALPTTASAPLAAGPPGADTVAWLVPLIECTLWSLFRFLVLYPLYCCNSLFNSLWYRDIADTAAALLLQDEEALRRERTKQFKEKNGPCRASFAAEKASCPAVPYCGPRSSGGAAAENRWSAPMKTEFACETKERTRLSNAPLPAVCDLNDASPTSSRAVARPGSVASDGAQDKPLADPGARRAGSVSRALQKRSTREQTSSSLGSSFFRIVGERAPGRLFARLRGVLWTGARGAEQTETCLGTREGASPFDASSTGGGKVFQERAAAVAAGGRHTEAGNHGESRLGKTARARFAGAQGPVAFASVFRETQRSSPKHWEVRNESEPDGPFFFAFFAHVCEWFSPSEKHALSTAPPVSPSAFYSASFFSSSPCPPAVGGPSSGGVSPCEFVLRLLIHYVWWIGASVVLPLVPFIGPPLSLINLSWLFAFYCFDWHDYLPYTSFSPSCASPSLPSSSAARSVDLWSENDGGTGCRGPQSGKEEGDRGRCQACFSMREEQRGRQRLHIVPEGCDRWITRDGPQGRLYPQRSCFPGGPRDRHSSASSTPERRLLGLRVGENDSLHFSSFSSFSPFSPHVSASRPASPVPRQAPWGETETLGDRGAHSVGRACRGRGQTDARSPGSAREEGEEVFARRVHAWVESQQKSLRLRHDGRAISPQMQMRIQRLAALFSIKREAGNARETKERGKGKGFSLRPLSKATDPAGGAAPRATMARIGSETRFRRPLAAHPGREASPAASPLSPACPEWASRGPNAPGLFRQDATARPRDTETEKTATREEGCHERRILFVGEMRSRVKYFEEHWLYFAGFGLPLCLVQFVCSSFVDYGVLSMLFPVCIVTSLHALPLRWVSRSDASLLGPYALFRRLPIFAPIQLLTRYMLRVVVRHFAKKERTRGAAKFGRK
ncbi:hypothetical protein NCLIV_049550 [Neospora caninum Liverpool]|nr:hypothetical protein NCLIV_049550 [Neospora caninum Liverpool]CBZ54526.1 hypothetical protein NCLIV_049550 [Neospora caninum Liverpool]|eukprot:XP_003884556.1 hypothetical protein NCLIV_049550 [Neospora caninum Liverpool]